MNTNTAVTRVAPISPVAIASAPVARVASVGADASVSMPALPSLRRPVAPIAPRKGPITFRGIPRDQILRSLADPLTPIPQQIEEDAFVVQHVAPSGAVSSSSRVTRAGAERAIRMYTNTRGADGGERVHVRKSGGYTDGNLVGVYRADRGRWISVAAF